MWSDAVVAAYLEHLADPDLNLLLGRDHASGGRPETLRAELRREPGRLEQRLSEQRVFDGVFGPGAHEPFLGLSPFLVFSVALARTALDLEELSYVEEWLGPGRRAPVFDVATLREFLADPWRRLFLAELLASYTRVASGSVVVATRRGWRRQRFSELDPVRLAGLLEMVTEDERPGILRRLGDLALFLTGVFPDHVARRGFPQLEMGRLARSGVLGRPAAGVEASAGSQAVILLEELGRRSYRAAYELLPEPRPLSVRVLSVLPERFGEGRRIVSFLTERYLFPRRDELFGRA